VRLTAILLLAAFPFIGGLLLAWLGSSRSWAARYRHARARNAALADEADRVRERLVEADARLAASQRKLRERI
jgi:hypothetical protein